MYRCPQQALPLVKWVIAAVVIHIAFPSLTLRRLVVV
jgi:hypothetical protein